MINRLRKILKDLCVECDGYVRENDIEWTLKRILKLFKIKP